MKKHTLLSCALAVLLSGCGALHKPVQQLSPDQEAELAKHVISIDPDGKLKPCNGNTDDTKYIACQEAYFQKITDGIEDFKKKRGGKETDVLFFVHGGLNDEEASTRRALENYSLIKRNGLYPIFVIWDSRGPSSYIDHLVSIRQGEEDSLAKYTWPIYLLTDIGNSVVNAPKAWLIAGDHLIDSTNKEQIKSARSLYWLLTSPAKAVTTPFAYTMAKPAWDIMLRRTNTLFYTPCDLEDRHADCKKQKPEETPQIPKGVAAYPAVRNSVIESKPGSGALSVFLQHIERELKTMPDMRITLIGHSMGAIVVNKIILMKPDLPYKNIVHLASADSVNHVLDIIVPYLDYALQKGQEKCKEPDSDDDCGGQPVQFYSLMLHPDNENRESAYKGLLPSGSLLTWIDEMYTTPETVMDRRSGRWDNIRKAIPLIPNEIAQNMHFKIFGINKSEECKNEENCLITTPQEHGDFDEMRFWDEATWK